MVTGITGRIPVRGVRTSAARNRQRMKNSLERERKSGFRKSKRREPLKRKCLTISNVAERLN